MIRRALGAWVAGLLLAGSAGAQKPEVQPSIDLVSLDISVVDGKGKPVTGLSLEDFVVKEDGRRVDIETFEEVKPVPASPGDSARSIVILLDDRAVQPQATTAVRSAAQVLLRNIPLGDDVAVIRL